MSITRLIENVPFTMADVPNAADGQAGERTTQAESPQIRMADVIGAVRKRAA